MSEPVKDYPPYLDYPKPRKKQTNADKYFRNATDEEIADFIAQRIRCEEHECPAYDFCTDYSAEGAMTKTQFCIRVLSKWLGKEAEE